MFLETNKDKMKKNYFQNNILEEMMNFMKIH